MGKIKNTKHMQLIWRPLRDCAVLAGLLLLLALPAFPQSCSLCYTQAASAGTRMIQALKSGILILVIPPTLGTIAMFFVIHRKRHQVRRTDYNHESGQDW